jgi:DNA polymerase III delta prime subunit
MKSNELLQNLKIKFSNNQLGHLYIIRYKSGAFSATNFYQEVIHSFTDKKIATHPDFLWVEIDEDEKFYKVDSKNIATFLKYISFRPTNIKKKFVMINDAHLISEVLLNKLLKTFEETEQFLTIFLMIPDHEQILATIKSRSIELFVNADQLEKVPTIHKSNDELQALFKKSALTIEELLSESIDQKINIQKCNYQQLDEYLNHLKTIHNASIFNGQTNTKIALMLP